MSSISFDSAEGSVLIGGRERARMGCLIDDLAWVMHKRGMDWMSPQDDARARAMWSAGGGSDFTERLGWACLIGNDQTKLLAHVHGQCEIHGWVHPDDGEWFAEIVERAVADGLLGFDDRGGHYGSWQDVADLARRSATPMVSAYSVCDPWPDQYAIAEYRPDLWALDEDGESFWELPEEERNRIADEALADCAPRWHPAEWGIFADKVRSLSPWVVGDELTRPAV